jgi:hypothetical protein
VSPADSFGTAIGVGIGIGVGIEPTNPLSAKLLAERVATLSERREQGHTTNEQSLLHAVVVCGQPNAHQRAPPQTHRSVVLWPGQRRSDSVATRSARSLADIGLVSSIPIPTPIAVPNESAGDTQAKNLFSLFLHHHQGIDIIT